MSNTAGPAMWLVILLTELVGILIGMPTRNSSQHSDPHIITVLGNQYSETVQLVIYHVTHERCCRGGTCSVVMCEGLVWILPNHCYTGNIMICEKRGSYE